MIKYEERHIYTLSRYWFYICDINYSYVYATTQLFFAQLTYVEPTWAVVSWWIHFMLTNFMYLFVICLGAFLFTRCKYVKIKSCDNNCSLLPGSDV